MSFMIRHGRLDLDALFDPDMLGDDLEAWLAESALMKRTFRNCAIISGLIARRFTGEEKTRRQVLFSTDLIYDVLRKHQADHVLLRAARADAATGLLDLRRLGDMLSRIQGRIIHRELDHVSPLAVPVMLEIGRESVYGEASDELLAEAAEELVKEAIVGLIRERCALTCASSHARARRWPGQPGHDEGHALALSTAHRMSRASRCSPISPARCSGKSRACSSSPICIWKKARASPRAACCCRPTIRWRR